MIYAEVRPDGKVHQVWWDKDEKFSPPILTDSVLLSFPDGTNVRPGMIWDGTQLLPPPPPSIQDLRNNAKRVVKEYADNVGKQLTAQYPEAEISSWPVKVAAAEAYLAGTASQRQKDMIDTEASIAGIPSVDLANAIVTKAAFFEKAAAMIAGMRQKIYAAIDAAQTQQEIDTILQQAKAEADQLLNDILTQMP